MTEFLIANKDDDYTTAANLFREYARYLEIDLGFQHFDKELQELKSMYALPFGAILLCRHDTGFIGCVGLRKIDDTTGELKRMFVRPAFQHMGIGQAMLDKVLKLARNTGYGSVRLDTLDHMLPAIKLYKKNGFIETTAYYHNPLPSAIYFQKYL